MEPLSNGYSRVRVKRGRSHAVESTTHAPMRLFGELVRPARCLQFRPAIVRPTANLLYKKLTNVLNYADEYQYSVLSPISDF